MYRALSLCYACIWSSGIILIPYSYLCPNFVSFAASIAELDDGEKSRTQSPYLASRNKSLIDWLIEWINHSITHPAYLMLWELTEALALRKIANQYLFNCRDKLLSLTDKALATAPPSYLFNSISRQPPRCTRTSLVLGLVQCTPYNRLLFENHKSLIPLRWLITLSLE